MAQNFFHSALSAGASYINAAAVTPSDSTPLTVPCHALYIGVSGDVAVFIGNDTVAVVFKAVPVGVLPVLASQVKSTGTTATNILALY